MNFKVLIIDDDLICLKVHKRIIEITNFHDTPQTFNSGQSALDYMASLPEKTIPVLIFLDINMPVMNGWDFLKIIHQEKFSNPVYVVVVTSSIDTRDSEKAFSYSKVIEVVVKPFTIMVPQMLKEKLSWLLAERSPGMICE